MTLTELTREADSRYAEYVAHLAGCGVCTKRVECAHGSTLRDAWGAANTALELAESEDRSLDLGEAAPWTPSL